MGFVSAEACDDRDRLAYDLRERDRLICYSVLVVFILQEVTELGIPTPENVVEYLSSGPWNFLQGMTIFMTLYTLAHEYEGEQIAPARWYESIAGLFMWINLLYYLRGFERPGPYVRMLIEIMRDVGWFVLVQLPIIFGFGHAMHIAESIYLQTDPYPYGFVKALQRMYRLGLLADPAIYADTFFDPGWADSSVFKLFGAPIRPERDFDTSYTTAAQADAGFEAHQMMLEVPEVGSTRDPAGAKIPWMFTPWSTIGDPEFYEPEMLPATQSTSGEWVPPMYLNYILFLGSTFLTMVLSLNVLIAVISETFTRVKEQEMSRGVKERANLFYEIDFRRKFKNLQRLWSRYRGVECDETDIGIGHKSFLFVATPG